MQTLRPWQEEHIQISSLMLTLKEEYLWPNKLLATLLMALKSEGMRLASLDSIPGTVWEWLAEKYSPPDIAGGCH